MDFYIYIYSRILRKFFLCISFEFSGKIRTIKKFMDINKSINVRLQLLGPLPAPLLDYKHFILPDVPVDVINILIEHATFFQNISEI